MAIQIKQRSPIAVLLLSIITFGIYEWYWRVKTKGEINVTNGDNPHILTAWIWVIPFGTIWWQWRYSEGAAKAISDKYSNAVVFLLTWLLGPIGDAILQDAFNKQKVATQATAPETPTPPTFN
ncbi:MAG: DUF4234 domain-containing protein [Candidatus Nanoperiomorbaceae bacterium]